MSSRSDENLEDNGPVDTEDADAQAEAMAMSYAEKYDIDLTVGAAQVIHQLEVERDDASAARQRALADYANFQRRARENETRAESIGMQRVIRSLLDVADQFDLVLAQNRDEVTVEQLLQGLALVKQEFHKALESHGVAKIEPAAGEPFDPNRHEAMLRQPAEGLDPNHVAGLLQAGYAMKDMVLRPAKVSVTPAED